MRCLVIRFPKCISLKIYGSHWPPVKFIKLKQDETNPKLYYLEQIPPFWETFEFQSNWKTRKEKIPFINEFPKKYPWRTEVNLFVNTFFKPKESSSRQEDASQLQYSDKSNFL